MKTRYNKSKIMRNAWFLRKIQPTMAFSVCLRKAWRNEKLAMLAAKIEGRNRVADDSGRLLRRAGAVLWRLIMRTSRIKNEKGTPQRPSPAPPPLSVTTGRATNGSVSAHFRGVRT